MNRLAMLEKIDRGEISAAEALRVLGGEEGEAPITEPPIEGVEPVVPAEEEEGGAPSAVPAGGEDGVAISTKREMAMVLAERVGDWDPQQLAAPEKGDRPWPWPEERWQWLWQNFDHPVHIDRAIDLAAGGELGAVLYGGELRLSGADGERLEIGAGAYDLRVGREAGAVRVAGSTGSIDLSVPAEVARLEARVLPGDLSARDLQLRELHLRCQGGDLRCERIRCGRLEVGLEGGMAELDEVEGEIDVAVVRGGLRVRGVRSTAVSLKGDEGIWLELDEVDQGAFRCEAQAGDIEVRLAGGSACDLAIDAGEGGIVCAEELPWSDLAERSGRVLRGALNGGGARIELVAHGGRIFIAAHR